MTPLEMDSSKCSLILASMLYHHFTQELPVVCLLCVPSTLIVLIFILCWDTILAKVIVIVQNLMYEACKVQ